MNRESDRLRRLRRALIELDGITRSVFLMSAAEGISYSEIGLRLGISAEDVERRLADALYQLDKHIERMEPWWRRRR